MQPSAHTRLMNYIIGMCKKNIDWITVLWENGYDVQIIEQIINTSSGLAVKPDVVTASNVLLHSLVFEAKGGISIKDDQMQRYATLKPSDLRWVTVFDPAHLRMDVCVCDLAENHALIRVRNTLFPMLTFGTDYLTKEGQFKLDRLNQIFEKPISLKGKLRPLNYYPFSDDDDQAYIAIHVFRTILSIALKNRQSGKSWSPDELKEYIFEFDEVLANKFNYVWNILATDHKKVLKSKITEATRILLADEEIRETLGIIQERKGYKLTQRLEQFQRQVIRVIEMLQSRKSQKSMSDYLQAS